MPPVVGRAASTADGCVRRLALLLVFALLPRSCLTCSRSLALPAGGGGAGAGWCPPFTDDVRDGVATVSTCTGISAPGAGAVLAFGTCALPGAVCTGATQLTLRNSSSGAVLAAVAAVALNSSVAAQHLGCVRGVRCSYGEWRNPSLAAADVAVDASCYGRTACAGVVAWRVMPDPALLPDMAATTAATLAFDLSVDATQSNLTVTELAGNAAGAASVRVFGRSGSAFAAGALAAASPAWTQLWSGTWTNGSVVLSPPLQVPAGSSAALLVQVTAGGALACAHALGSPAEQLLADDALRVSQGAAVSGAFSSGAAVGAACAWDGLALTYNATAACAPPAPDIVTSAPNTLVASLDDLLRALANPLVQFIELDDNIVLNGTQLEVTVGGSGTRTLVIEGTNACERRNPAAPLCSIDADGFSRALEVTAGVQLELRHLLLRDGAAPGDAGGCVLVSCAGCGLQLTAVSMRNCSAAQGGALAVTGGGALYATELYVSDSSAGLGGGLLASSGPVQLLNSTFHGNTAAGLSTDTTLLLAALRGPMGGGVALFNVTGAVSGCTFDGNAATTSDVVLLANPGVPQARGGGLFVASSVLAVSTSTARSNAASFGGGMYFYRSRMSVSACALVGNVATLGDGGGLFVSNCGFANINDTLIVSNAAGGEMGGGLAAVNTRVSLTRCALHDNQALDGCGGGAGLDSGATLSVLSGTVFSANVALDGGGACCTDCVNMTVAHALLYDNVALGDSGGAVHATNSPTYLLNTTMMRNTAPEGGAVGAYSSDLTLVDCELHDNQATLTHGGAIFHDSTVDSLQSLSLTGCWLQNNTAIASGGAVALLWAASATFSNCTFQNNTIYNYSPAGGALMVLNVGSLAVANSTFEDNWCHFAPELANDAPLGYVSNVIAPSTGSGGALWVGADTAMSASVQGSLFSRNSADSGGAIFATGQIVFSIGWSTLEHNEAMGSSVEGGGGMALSRQVTAAVDHTRFYNCSAIRGGGVWQGMTSSAAFTDSDFEANVAKLGDSTKGSALFLGEESSATLTRVLLQRNEASHGGDGTVAVYDNATLALVDSTFLGNTAQLGGCIAMEAHSQAVQLRVSGCTFRDNTAFIGAVLFTDAEDFAELACAPAQCSLQNNSATDYGDVSATPPHDINVTLPSQLRSGGPLPISVSLMDGFGQVLEAWPDTVATLSSGAIIAGSLRSFYSDGAAVFPSLTMKGNVSVAYTLSITVTAADLFGNGQDSQTVTRNVLVQACETTENWDPVNLDCNCADGYGLVVADHTCRRCTASEVVPPGGLSCVACPLRSSPASSSECECNPGYFGTLFGASGVCTLCPVDAYRGAGDPPVACLECPATSHTFVTGATSAADCLCAINTFGDVRDGSFQCAAVPDGGWAPQADTRLFALEGFWRPDANYTAFFSCAHDMCLREEPPANNETQLGHACRTGHTGHLCAVCEPGWAYQGVFCEHCKKGETFAEWGAAKKGGLLFIGLFLLCLVVFLLFFLPLFPAAEAALDAAVTPFSERVERMLGAASAAVRPHSSAGRSRPTSAAMSVRPTEDEPPPPRTSHPRRTSFALRRRTVSLAGRRTSRGGDKKEFSTSQQFAVPMERPSRVKVLISTVAGLGRIIISFLQILTSFSANLYVPWPSIYYSLASSLSVMSLKFIRLQGVACVSPEVSFLTVFHGVTLSTFIFIAFSGAMYYFGQRAQACREDPERRRRFKSRVLNLGVWGLFLIFPQVASTTLLIFSCTELEDGTFWLQADLRIKCYTPQHRLHMGIGGFWVLCYPFGIPAAFMYVLYRARVPQLAAWKRDCAWLRAIVHRATVLGVRTSAPFDPDTITTESISLEHLRKLHQLFVGMNDDSAQSGQENTGKSGMTVRQLLNAVHAAALAPDEAAPAEQPPPLPRQQLAERSVHGPQQQLAERSAHGATAGNRVFDRRASTRILAAPPQEDSAPEEVRERQLAVQAPAAEPSTHTYGRRASTRVLAPRPPSPPPEGRLGALLHAVRKRMGRAALVTQVRAKTMRRTLSNLLYSNERELLLAALLERARHDKHGFVAQPSDNMLRWRPQAEWVALQRSGARLGERDTAERAAFYKYRFIFSDYAVHAWYWESMDLLNKLFLTSIIAFIAPRTSVQVIVATMFSFLMLLLTIQVKPYRERSNQQLLTLSQMNIFLFLFTGLLLQTNPDGITSNQLVFAVIVGALATSLVGFTFYIFMRELAWQFMAALFEIDDEEAAEEEEAELADEAARASEAHLQLALAVNRQVRVLASPSGSSEDAAAAHWDDSGADIDLKHVVSRAPERDDSAEHSEEARSAPPPQPARNGNVAAVGTPPAPAWVTRLTARPSDSGDADAV